MRFNIKTAQFRLKDIRMETKQLSETSQNKQIVSFEDEIEFDDGESDYEIEYDTNRKILTQKTEYSIEYLHRLERRGRLNLQPDFQRQYVWDVVKASSLIESLLLDVPIPPIYLSEDDDEILSVIDGQQRLGSIFAFINGIFPDNKKFNLKKLKVLRDLNNCHYKTIDALYQDKFDSAAISTIIIKKESDPELKFDIFERLNTGSVKLNDQELRNCIYRGQYLNVIKEMSTNKDFKYIMGLKKADKRMKDVEYVLRFAAFYHQSYLQYSKSLNMKNFLNLEMKNHQHIEEEEIEDLKGAFKKAVQINKSLFGNRSFRRIKLGDQENHNLSWKNTTVVNGALYDLMMVSFIDYDKNMIYRNLDAIKEAFIYLVTEHEEFIDCIEKWTNSFSQIKKRFEIFNESISAIFKMDTKQERCFSFQFKENLFKLNNNCKICNQTIYAVEDAAVDHIEQYWLGGKTIPENGRLVHRYCNAARRRKEGSGQLSENLLADPEEVDSFLPKDDIKWEKMFSELVKIKEEHGHCKVPNYYPKDQALGSWVAKQRTDKKKNLLNDDSIRLLEAIGFTWENPPTIYWEKMYSELVEFKKVKGHCDIPISLTEKKELRHWINTQRGLYGKGKLSEEYIQLLNAIGFQW